MVREQFFFSNYTSKCEYFSIIILKINEKICGTIVEKRILE